MENPASSPVEIGLLTPPGRGALAVIGVSGTGAVDLVGRVFAPRGGRPLVARPDSSVAFGRWGDSERGEELIVVRQAADRVEVHCHGGLAASTAVIASLESLGAVARASWGLSRASTGFGLLSPPSPAVVRRHTIDREAREALARVAGHRAARILCRQLAGVLADELDRIDALRASGDRAAAAALDRLRQAARVGLRLVDPWRVVLSGPVNAGKSSLINALAGYARSIVSAEPGTTRDVVTTRLVIGGWEIDLIDTAGLRAPGEATSPTERAGIERAMAAAATADLIVDVRPIGWVQESQPFCLGTPRITVISQGDLAPAVVAPPGALLTSALTGQGIESLAHAIVASVVPEEANDPALLAGPMPFMPRQVTDVRLV